MFKGIKRNWLLLIKGVTLILLAMLIFQHTKETIVTVSVYMGSGLILMGIIILIICLELKRKMERWNMRLAEGLVDIVFGFFLLAHPEVTEQTIPVFIGFWIIFYGIIMLTGALDLPKEHTIRKKLVVFIAIITLILGFLVSFNPIVGIVTMGMLIGIPIFIIGLANIFFAFNNQESDSQVANEITETE